MEEQILDSMKKYLSPKIIVATIVFAISIIMLVIFLILKPVLNIELFEALCSIVGIISVVAFLSSIAGIISKVAINKQIKAFEESGELKNVLYSFQSAQPMYNERIMLGNDYIFCKGRPVILRYCDIDRIYLYIHSTNAVKDQRILKVKLINGKHIELCNLKVYKNTEDEENAIIDFILRKNPNIQLGYQP